MNPPPHPNGPAGPDRPGRPGGPGTLALARDLYRLGVRRRTQLLVHAALGGTGLRAERLRDALRGVLGPDGTLVVPAFTAENSLTSAAHLARIEGMSEPQVRAFRAGMRAFDPERTPSQRMGCFAELVRRSPGSARSGHPQTSFAALGKDAERLCAGHRRECHLGEESPLGKMCWEGGQVLMINVGFAVCTAFHLAEYRIPKPPLRMYDCVVKVNLPGGRQGEGWAAYEDVVLDDNDFTKIGEAFPDSRMRRGLVGGAAATLFSIPDAVDHAVDWMTENRC